FENLVADQVDVADLGGLAFLDRDRDIDAVARQLGHGRGDRDVVLAAVVVLPGQLLGNAVKAELVERVALGQADVGEAFEQVLRFQVLVAAEGQGVDRRTLEHGHDQDAALVADVDVLEEPGLVQRADRVADGGLVDRVATLDRKVGEDGTGGNTLQAVDADVAHGERGEDRKSTRLNSSHVKISYAVFCLKK